MTSEEDYCTTYVAIFRKLAKDPARSLGVNLAGYRRRLFIFPATLWHDEVRFAKTQAFQMGRKSSATSRKCDQGQLQIVDLEIGHGDTREGLAMNDSKTIIAALETAPTIIIPLVREVPHHILKRRPQPGKWSAHEHACHLAEVHPVFFSRLDLMLSDPAPHITPYFPSQDDEEGALLKVDLDGAMDRFVQDRNRLVKRLKGLSADDWHRTAEHGTYSRYSIFIMFRHLALHDMLHAYRIERLVLKKDWGQAERDPE